MKQSELIKTLGERLQLSQSETHRLLNLYLQQLKDLLKKGLSINLPHLGTFKVREKKNRIAYNPHYKQKMILPPSRTPVFKPSSEMKDRFKDKEAPK